jgi:hypothetical protein
VIRSLNFFVCGSEEICRHDIPLLGFIPFFSAYFIPHYILKCVRFFFFAYVYEEILISPQSIDNAWIIVVSLVWQQNGEYEIFIEAYRDLLLCLKLCTFPFQKHIDHKLSVGAFLFGFG